MKNSATMIATLPENRQNEFTYQGKKYKAMGNFGFSGWNAPFTHIFKDNIKNDTPVGYNFDEFSKTARQNNASAEIFECEGRFLVPYGPFIAEYRNEARPL